MANGPKLLSGRVPVVPLDQLTSDRYQYLSVGQAEPNLGNGVANSILTIQSNGNRVWANSVTLTTGLFSGNVTAANFVGNIIGNITAPGSNTQVLFNDSGIVAGNAALTFDKATALLRVTGDALVTGNFTVNGTTSYINVTNLNIQDPIIGIGRGPNNAPLVSNDNKDRGEQLWYYTTSEKSAFVGYDNSAANLILATDVSITNEIVTVNNYGNVTVGNISGQFVAVSANVNANNFVASSNISATGNVSGNFMLGNGYYLTGIITSVANINNGTSNVRIDTPDGNILANVGGVANVFAITTVGANVAGTFGVTGNITGGNLTTTGIANVGTLAVTGAATVVGNATVTANIAGGNITTAGLISATGNITATANIAGGNITTAGLITATGNITGGNLTTTGIANVGTLSVTGSGNVTGNLGVAGNISSGNSISTLFSSTNTNVSIPGPGNTAAERLRIYGFNNPAETNYAIGAETGYIWTAVDIVSDTLGFKWYGGNTLAATLTSSGKFTAVGNITGSNLNTAGLITATGNIIGGNLTTAGIANVGTLAVTGGVSIAGNITGNLNVTGNIAGGNITTPGLISATANIRGGNLTTTGIANVGTLAVTGTAAITGNTTVTANIAGGNITTAGVINATGNVSGGNIISNGIVSTNNVVGSLSNVTVTAGSYVTTFDNTGNVTFPGNAIATSNVIGGNLTTAGIANVGTLAVTGTSSHTGNASFGNISASGLASITGNITGGNLTTTGIGNIGTLSVTGTAAITGNTTVTANIAGGNITTAGIVTATGNVTGGNLNTAGLISATGNITGGNLTTTGIANVGTLAVTGAATITGNTTVTANISGGNITTGGLISATGNITGGNLLTAGQIVSTQPGNVTTGAAQFYLNGTGNNRIEFNTAGLGVPDATTRSAGTKIVLYPLVDGSGVDYAIGTASGVVWFSVHDAARSFAWYANTTAVATLTGTGNFSATGNIAGGNITTAGLISASGNITATANIAGGNITTAGLITATGNITGGNLRTAGIANIGTLAVTGTATVVGNTTVTANIAGGNITTAGIVTATGNVTGGNLVTAGIANVAGNVYGNNLIAAANVEVLGNKITTGTTTGLLFEPGNVSLISGNLIVNGGYIYSQNGDTAIVLVNNGEIGSIGIQNNLQVGKDGAGNLDVAGYANLTSDVSVGGQITVTGNVSGANVNTAGLISATGNVTGGNLITSGRVVATGNINTTANVVAANVVTANINSTGGIIITTGSSGDITLDPSGTGNVVLGDTTYINNIKYPVQDQDAASKIYVDNFATTGISYHSPVTAATTVSLATATGGTISYAQPNGVANGIGATITTTGSFNLIDTANIQTVGTRLLVKNEGNAVLNGVYTWANASAIVRSTDADVYGANSSEEISVNDYFFVQNGSVNAGTAWIVNSPTGTITFGTSNITFGQFSSSQTYTAGNGIDISGTIISAKVDNNTTAFDGTGNIIVKAGANLTTPNIGAATGVSLTTTGNITANNITANNYFAATTINATANITGGNIISNGAAVITGNASAGNLAVTTFANVSGNLHAFGNAHFGQDLSFAAAYANLQYAGSANSYVQLIAQNKDNGSAASTDFVATADNGTDADTYIDMGINSSGYSQAGYGLQRANDGYLYVAGNNVTGGGNLVLSTLENNDIIFSTGGADTGDEQGRFQFGNGFKVTGNTYATGNAHAPYFIGNLIGNVTGNLNVTGPNTGVVFNDNGVANSTLGFTFNKTTNAVVVTGNITTAGQIISTQAGSATTGAGQLYLNGATLNRIDWNTNGTGAPALTTRSAGTKLLLYPAISGSQVDYAMGIDAATMWSSIPVNSSSFKFKWYGATTEIANLDGAGNFSVTSNITGGNLTTTGIANVGTLSVTGSGNVAGNLGVAGNVNASYFLGNGACLTGVITSVANINNGNSNVRIDTAGGNIYANVGGVANVVIISSNALTVTGNIQSSSGFFVGNGVYLTGVVAASSNSTGVTNINYGTSNVRIDTPDGNILANVGGVANVFAITTAGANVTGTLGVTGNITGGNLTTTGIANVGTLSVTGSGNVAGNLGITGNVNASYFLGNGACLTGVITSVANINNGNSNVRIDTAGGNVYANVGGVANVFAITPIGANVAGNLDATSNVSAAYFIGNGSQLSGISTTTSKIFNGTSNVRIDDLNGNVYANVGGTANVFVITSAGANVTGTAGVTGNITGGNVLATAGMVSALNFVGAVQAQVGSSFAYSLNAFGAGSDTGAVFLPADANSNAITAGYTIVSNTAVTLTVTSATVVVGSPNFVQVATTPTASSFTYPVTVYTANYIPALPLSTLSVGNATVTANIAGGNITTGGLISATGNITGGNLTTTGIANVGTLSVTGSGNVTGNLGVAGNVSASYFLGNGSQLTGINVSTSSISNGSSNVSIPVVNGNINASVGGTANVFVVTTGGANVAGNLGVSSNVSAAYFLGNANATSLTSGTVPSARLTGTYAINISGLAATANTVTDAAQPNITSVGTLSALTVTGNVAGGNLTTTGLISATGNITGGNLVTSGSGGNITGANVVSATTFTATANVTGGNLTTTGIANVGTLSVTGSGNVAGNLGVTGNVSASYFLGNGSQLTGINVSTSSITNGTSNVTIPVANGNVNTSVDGTANVLVVTSTGANIAGTLNSTGNITGGNANITGTTAATSKTTGALKVAGGVGVAGDVWAGNSVVVDGGAYGNVTTTQFASVFGTGAGPNPYSIMQVRSNDGVSGLGMMAFPGSGTLYGNAVINFALATIRDKDVPSSLVTKAYIDSTGLTVTGLANVSGNITGGNLTTTGSGNIGTLNVTGDALISGNLVVNGTTSNVNVTNLNIQDPIIGIGRGANNAPLVTNDGKDRGEQLWYYAGSEKSSFIGYDNSAGNLIAAVDVSIASEVVTVNSYGNFVVGTLAASTVNSTGTINATGNVTGGNVTTGGNVSGTYLLGNGYYMSGIATLSTVYYQLQVQGNVTGNSLGNSTLTASNSSGILYPRSGNGITMSGNATSGVLTISITGSTNDGTFWANNEDCGLVTGSLDAPSVDNGSVADSVTSAYDLGAMDFAANYSSIASDVLPATTNTYVVGNSSLSWKSIYADGNITTANGYFIGNGALLTGIVTGGSGSGNSISNGTSSIAIATANGNATVSIAGNANVVVWSPGQAQFKGNVVPAANAIYNLGSAALQWNSLYVAGNTIYLGNISLKAGAGNSLGVYGADGSTPGAVLSSSGFSYNAPNISGNGNISNTYNALSSGPITINNNITVTVDNGATWSIV